MSEKSLLLDNDSNNTNLQESNLNFPHKLHFILDQNKFPELIAWKEHGCSFQIIHQVRFAAEVLPDIFKQSKWGSFQRQLNVYGVKKISKGADQGCYFHPYLRRGREDLLKKMKRFNLIKDLLLNADHYYYAKILPAVSVTTPSSSSSSTISPQSVLFSPSSRPPVHPSSPQSTRSLFPQQQRTFPMESTTNPMMMNQQSPATQPMSSNPTSSLPSPPSISSLPSSQNHQQHYIPTMFPESFFPRAPPSSASSPANPTGHLDAQVSRPTSFNSYFLKSTPPDYTVFPHQALPPLPPLHQPDLPRSTSAIVLSTTSTQCEMMEDSGYYSSHHSYEYAPSTVAGGDHYSRSISISETSSVTPSMMTETDSYITNDCSHSASMEHMESQYFRDPYRLQYSYHPPPPPFIGMMIGGGSSISRYDEDDFDIEEEEGEDIDRYIVEYFKHSDVTDDYTTGMETAGNSSGSYLSAPLIQQPQQQHLPYYQQSLLGNHNPTLVRSSFTKQPAVVAAGSVMYNKDNSNNTGPSLATTIGTSENPQFQSLVNPASVEMDLSMPPPSPERRSLNHYL